MLIRISGHIIAEVAEPIVDKGGSHGLLLVTQKDGQNADLLAFLKA